MSPSNDEIAAAFERRLQQQREEVQADAGPIDFDENHHKRQEFRRMIDPGILRPNAKDLAVEALQTLKTLAENIVAHPDEEKYRKFKPTNSKIKRVLVEPKGTLEYAVAMGFRPEVEEFQPYYIFDKRHMPDLKIGLYIIEETLGRELARQEREEQTKREVKEAEAAAKEKLKQQFLDDRKSTAMRQQREREAREVAAARRASAAASSSSLSSPSSREASVPSSQPQSPIPLRTSVDGRSTPRMGGIGRTLAGRVVPDEHDTAIAQAHDTPPPYEEEPVDDAYDDQ